MNSVVQETPVWQTGNWLVEEPLNLRNKFVCLPHLEITVCL